jgi:hypothetical protein
LRAARPWRSWDDPSVDAGFQVDQGLRLDSQIDDKIYRLRP